MMMLPEKEKRFMSIFFQKENPYQGNISEQNIGNLSPGMEVTIRSRVDETTDGR